MHIQFHQGLSCPWYCLLVCLSLHVLSCSQAFFLSLSHKGSRLPTVLPAILPRSPQRGSKLRLEGALG